MKTIPFTIVPKKKYLEYTKQMKDCTLKVQNINGRNFKRYKQMETCPVFTDWKN